MKRPPHYSRGYGRIFLDHVLQADEGRDFHFLRGKRPSPLKIPPAPATPWPGSGLTLRPCR